MGSNRYLIEWSPTKTRKRAISVNCREIGCRPVIGWIIVVDLAGQASFHIFRFALASECKLQIMNELLENGILLAKQKQLFVKIHSKKEDNLRLDSFWRSKQTRLLPPKRTATSHREVRQTRPLHDRCSNC